MQLTPGTNHPFDRFVPVYNWLYPLGRGLPRPIEDLSCIAGVKARALYVHIPFCDTVCSFCPFVRSPTKQTAEIEEYVRALLREIELKAALLRSTPVRAIFFGGGTPSLLTPEQILRIGSVLHSCFDTSDVAEFSYEFEAKSASQGVIQAAKEIGVTHARFGLQTISPRFRRLFELTATIDHLTNCASGLSAAFPHSSCDVLYGINGQDVDEVLADIEFATSLPVTNIDAYPLNNAVIQAKLQREFLRQNLSPISGTTKHFLRQMIRVLFQQKGFVPHNGHGYVRSPESSTFSGVVSGEYSFVYHEHVYGFDSFDLIGFGVNGISSSRGLHAINESSRRKYIHALRDGRIPTRVFGHSAEIDAARPIALALPYHGRIEIADVNWEDLGSEVVERLNQCVSAGLVERIGDAFALTRRGWDYYSDMMFYLLPDIERISLSQSIIRAVASSRRDLGDLRAAGVA